MWLLVLVGHADYHSVDSGDVLTGRPYGYTEEYQSYEQTGSTTTYTYGMSTCAYGCPQFVFLGGYFWCTVDYPASAIVKAGSACPYKTTTPTYGYITRTRVVTYDKQSGLFSLGIGVPYAAYNANLYSTRRGTVPAGRMYYRYAR